MIGLKIKLFIFFIVFSLMFSGCRKVVSLENKEYILFSTPPLCSSKNERVLFKNKSKFSIVKGSGELFLINLEGKEEIQLTFSPNWEYNFSSAWSPDGNRIVFSSSSGDLTKLIGIFIMDFKKKKIFKIEEYGEEASFSPDGKRIVFTTAEAYTKKHSDLYPESDSYNHDIYIIDVNGKNKRRLTFTPKCSEHYPSFSPDGKKIMFVLSDFNFEDERNDGIYTMNLNDGSIKRITDNPLDNRPVYSPDGNKIAFVSKRKNDKKGKIYIADSDGKNIKRLTNDDPLRKEDSPSWSCDGKMIVFEGVFFPSPEKNRKHGGHDLFIVDVNGKNLKRLTFSPTRLESNPSWRPRVKK